MAFALVQVVAYFKGDVGSVRFGDSIRDTCSKLNITFRERLFTPMITLHVLFEQILHGNVANLALPHLCGLVSATSSYLDSATFSRRE